MNQDLLERVVSCPRLPSLPAIAVEVIELCRQDEVTIPHIAETISKDPALSSKILRTVNSSFYGLSQPVGTIRHALVILGLRTVRSLALGFTLVGNFRHTGGEHFDPAVIWRRALYGAVATRCIARQVGIEEDEEAFLAGLLQDLGVLAMIQKIGPDYVQLLCEVNDRHRDLWQAERKRFELDHAAVGAEMARRWKLPVLLSTCMAYHEQPANAPRHLESIARAVTLGGMGADVYLHPAPEQALRTFLESAGRWFAIKETSGRRLLRQIGESTRELSRLFEIRMGQVNDVVDILTDANELLLEMSLQTEQNAKALEAENRTLQAEVARDPLTGIGNRGHFNTCLRRFFALARRHTAPMSLLMIDADRFKPINDNYGHFAGDAALVALASLLQENAPAQAEVCRYGGEEFGILLPGVDRAQAGRLAEHIRHRIEQMQVAIEGAEPLRLTASVGVATFDGVRFFRRAEQLAKAADRAVYAAKAAGRNRVRIFSPREPQPVAGGAG